MKSAVNEVFELDDTSPMLALSETSEGGASAANAVSSAGSGSRSVRSGRRGKWRRVGFKCDAGDREEECYEAYYLIMCTGLYIEMRSEGEVFICAISRL